MIFLLEENEAITPILREMSVIYELDKVDKLMEMVGTRK